MLDKRLNDKGKNWRHVFKVGRAFPVTEWTSGDGSDGTHESESSPTSTPASARIMRRATS